VASSAAGNGVGGGKKFRSSLGWKGQAAAQEGLFVWREIIKINGCSGLF